MTSPLVLPKTAKEAQEMLRAAGLPELTPPVIAEIVGMEGENFTQALATVAQGNVDREHPSLRYLLQIIAACVPATRAVLERIGMKGVKLTALIEISKMEGRTFAQAIRTINGNEMAAENAHSRQYLTRVVSPYVTVAPEDPAPAAAEQHPNAPHREAPQPYGRQEAPPRPAQQNSRAQGPAQGSVTPFPARSRQERDNPGSTQPATGRTPATGGEAPDRKFTSVHLYAGKAALCFSPDETRKDTNPTVRVEAAKASGPRQYDWGSKVSFQMTVSELPLVFGVLYGLTPKVELTGHGIENEKSMSIEEQGGKFFFSMRVRGGTVYPVPVPAKDAYPIMTMILEQMQKNAPRLPTAQIIQLAKRVCDMYRNGLSDQQPRVANG